MHIAVRRTATLAIAAALALSACGGSDDADSPSPDEPTPTAAADDGSSEADDGDTGADIATSTSRLPDDWPADVPLPRGIEVVGGTSIGAGDEGHQIAVAALVPMTIEELDAFYAAALTDWTETYRTEVVIDGAPSLSVGYELDGRVLLIGGNERDGQTEVGFTYTAPSGGGSAASGDVSVDVSADDLGIDGAQEALDALGIDGIAAALKIALSAERTEVEGGTIHIYLGAASSYTSQIACIAATAVSSDAPVVVHEARGDTTDC